jgi:hypothetical protein
MRVTQAAVERMIWYRSSPKVQLVDELKKMNEEWATIEGWVKIKATS